MNKRETLLSQVRDLPEPLLDDALDFMRVLKAGPLPKQKSRKRHRASPRATYTSAVLSESALEKDWLKPEEDEAWQRL